MKPFLDLGRLKKILYIGIPNGVENGIFQFGRILVVSIISGFGTVQIAANAVANNIAGMETIPGFAVGIGRITVIGQCMGAGDYGQAEYFYQLTPETLHLAMILLIIHGWGVIGVWSAMILDWLFRGALFRLRFRSRKWQRIKLI